MKYTINTTAEQDMLLEKSGADVQAVLVNKIDELVNLGVKASHDDLAFAYENGDAQVRAQLDAVVDAVKTAEAALVDAE